MAETDEFWTAEEVSTYLRIPLSTIYELAQDKVLPGFKVGKHWWFKKQPKRMVRYNEIHSRESYENHSR